MPSTSASGRWPVIISSRAIRELRHLGRDKNTLEIVRKKIHELSHGQFSPDNYLPIRGTPDNIPIYRARASNDLRIIYQVDLAADPDAQFDHQVLKVFSVSSRARVSYEFWVKVSKYLVRLGAEYKKRCTARNRLENSDGPIYSPQAFDHEEYNNAFVDNNYVFEGEAELNELHETLVLEKFTPITKSLYNSILADMEAVLPMALNPDEKRIVRHQGTSVVVGRSGTGKTTALVYKLRANTQAAAMLNDEVPIRQLFVTRSRVLTQHIAHNYRGLIESSEIANKSREELAEMRQKNEQKRKRELVEFDNEVDLRDDLPGRFSCLEDHHFPLFVSFDKLCSLLEADVAALRGGALQKQPTTKVINFTDFKYKYWPKFDHALTRNLDPGLVFSEILGVIKGCGEDLSEEDYLSSLSHKKSPLLLNVRDKVYAIFEAYSKQTRIRNEIDGADRTRAILRAHERDPLPKNSQVDYLFVDEVQDQLMLDIHLLQSLCSSPNGGYWCGDTAQTISVGSSFRIKDLKAFIYNDMLSYQRPDNQRKAPAPFSTFELSTNFRSHSGIVRYAASLVELIYTLFPNSIDHMAPETAKTSGRPPLLFVSPTNEESVFMGHLLSTKSSDGTPFGAHQAIIVRSESTANSLARQLQKRCTILTLLETKGLEFDDLILYNFFSESEAPSACWESILSLKGENRDGRIVYDKHTAPPSVSPTLCSELKQLYVAVTRARHRCWIWDSGDVIEIMKDFWSNFELITMSKSLEDVAAFAGDLINCSCLLVSTKDLHEWARRGQEFFSNGLYVLAKSCFENANQGEEADIADAYHHMAEAKRTQNKLDYLKAASRMERRARRADTEQSASVLWYHAATCFEAARDIPGASRSYRNGKFYDRAALIAFEHQHFDDALLTILHHSNDMDRSLFQKIRDVSRMHYLRMSNYEKLRKLFGNDQNACIEYARSAGFSAQMKDLLKQSGRLEDLANVYLAEGSPAEAAELLLKSSAHPTHISRVKGIASSYLWLNLALDSTPDEKVREQSSKLLGILSPFEESDSSGPMAFDLRLFKASLGQAAVNLDLLDMMDLQRPEHKYRLVLGYHHALQSNKWANDGSSDVAQVLRHLKAWSTYTSNIQSITKLRNPTQLPSIQRLLGCSVPRKKPRNGHFLNIASSSFLYGCAKNLDHVRIDKKTSPGETLMSGTAVDQIIKRELSERIKSRLLNLHFELLDSPWVNSPVTPSTECPATAASFGSHTPTFEEQIRVVFMVATVLDPIRACTLERPTNVVIEDAWMARMFNLINPPTGMISTLAMLPRPSDDDASEECFRKWVHGRLWSLDPTGNDKMQFISVLLTGLSLLYELSSRCDPHFGTLCPPDYAQYLIHHGCSTEPCSIAADLSCLFHRDDQSRVIRGIRVLRHIVDHELDIDLALLVHLSERVTREAIIAERIAISTHLLGGISGLIMPLSWARSLISYPKLKKSSFDVGPLQDLILCISGVIRRIQDRIPACWQPTDAAPWRHSALSLSLRMYWCIALIIVNIHPGHSSLGPALDAMQKGAAELADIFKHEDLRTGDGMDSKLETITAAHDQRTCLLALTQTLQHEELLLLARNEELNCPAKRRFVSNIIAFDSLVDLRRAVFGQSADAGPVIDTVVEEQNSVPRVDAQTTSVSTEEEQVPITPKPEEKVDRTGQAVRRIQTWWRRYLEREDLMESSKLSQEGECYRRFSPLISKRIVGMSKRDVLLRKMLRGPGLLVILSLEVLGDQLEESLTFTLDGLRAPGIDGNDIADLQERERLLRGFYETAESLRKELSPDSPPKVFKANSLVTIKTRLTGNTKTLFADIRKSNVLQDNKAFEAFEAAEAMLLRGVDIIRARVA